MKNSNEEFQKIVLEELKGLREGQNELNTKVGSLDTKVGILESSVASLEKGQQEIKRQLDAITEQTTDLSEFRTETIEKLDTIIDENEILQEIVGTHEVSIRRIQRRVV